MDLILITITIVSGIIGVLVGSIITYYLNRKILKNQEIHKILGKINEKQVLFFTKAVDVTRFSKEHKNDKKAFKSKDFKKLEKEMFDALSDLYWEAPKYFYFLDDDSIHKLREITLIIKRIVSKRNFEMGAVSYNMNKITEFLQTSLKTARKYYI